MESAEKKKKCHRGGSSTKKRGATTTKAREEFAAMAISGDEIPSDPTDTITTSDDMPVEQEIAAKNEPTEAVKQEEDYVDISDMELESESDDSDCQFVAVVKAKKDPFGNGYSIGGPSGDFGSTPRKRGHDEESNQMLKRCRTRRDPAMRSRSPSIESSADSRLVRAGHGADFVARYNVAEQVIEILTPQLKLAGRYDYAFGGKVRDTLMAVLAAEYKSMDFYIYLRQLGRYDLLSTISRLMKHHSTYGNMTPRHRDILMRILEKTQMALVVGGIGSGGPCAQHQPFSFAQWADKKGELSLTEVKVLDRPVTQPLGLAYDGKKGFIFTGNAQEVMRCDEEGEDFEVLVADARNPSAVAIIRCGERFAYLENRGIYIYDFFTNSTVQFINPYSYSRGLVYLPSGHLVTSSFNMNRVCLTAYDLNSTESSVLPYSESRKPTQTPSFMASSGQMIYCTHLDLRRLHIFSLRNGVLHPEASLSLERGVPRPCSYPSGVAVDSRKEVIVCEANRTQGFLMWGTASGDDWRVIKMYSPFPYSAQIAVSPGGTLMAACRGSNTMRLFSFFQEKK